jgi:small subunit ribosomal protein S2
MPEPIEIVDNQPIDPSLEGLFRAGVHFGYARTRRHPRMRNFVAGVKSNIEIFHLEKVWTELSRALAFMESLGKEKSAVLWVGTKPAAAETIQKIAEEFGHPYVNKRWIGGTLTNNKVIRDRINYWQGLVEKKKSGELAKYTKQEQLMIQREIDRLSVSFGGLVSYASMPKAMVIIDTNEEVNALREAQLKRIPVVALMNTDCDPDGITYPIPGNDNAPHSISYILGKLHEAYKKGISEASNG